MQFVLKDVVADFSPQGRLLDVVFLSYNIKWLFFCFVLSETPLICIRFPLIFFLIGSEYIV